MFTRKRRNTSIYGKNREKRGNCVASPVYPMEERVETKNKESNERGEKSLNRDC